MNALSSVNRVVLAKNYNPSIISKEWLSEKRIITDPVNNFVHMPVFSLVETDRFSLTIDENRLQLSVKVANPINLEDLPRVADKIVSCLPETPYVAVGFNLNYRIPKESYHGIKLFSPNEELLARLFSERYELGGIIIFQFGDFTARLNIQPPAADTKPVIIDFNFHSDAIGEGEVRQRLSQYVEVSERATAIVEELCTYD